MKITKVKITNFRNLPEIDQDLCGKNIILLADNTLGKTNFIRALEGALGGKVGKNSVKKGQKKAEVKVAMSDFNEKNEPIEGTDYTFCLKINKVKDTEEENVVLELHAPNGLKETRKTIIGSIAGEIELDYNFVELSKTKEGKRKQVEIIKSYLDTETIEALRAFDNKTKIAYDERTGINRDIKNLEGYLTKISLSPDDFKEFAQPKTFVELQEKINKANESNSKIMAVEERFRSRNEDIEKKMAEIDKLQKECEEMLKLNIDAKNWLTANVKVDVTGLNAELSTIGAHNEKHLLVKDFLAKRKEKEEKEAEVGELTALIDSNKQAINDTIRQMDFPIKGITFDDENVYFNDKLIDETSMSTAEIMILESELKFAKNPKAQVLFIQRAESIGLPLFKELQKRAKEKGMQIIAEQVERGTEELKIEFMPNF